MPAVRSKPPLFFESTIGMWSSDLNSDGTTPPRAASRVGFHQTRRESAEIRHFLDKDAPIQSDVYPGMRDEMFLSTSGRRWRKHMMVQRLAPTISKISQLLVFLLLFTASGALAQFSVQGKYVLDPNGNIYTIHGVNRSSLEFECCNTVGDGHFTQTDMNTIASWGTNTIRVPLNQDYGLSDSSCYQSDYISTLQSVVSMANTAGMNVLFDLHWTDLGIADTCSGGQKPMADTRSITFLETLATTFKSNPQVFIDLFNEPFETSPACWLNGCWLADPDNSTTWQVVGMQALYTAVRGTGFTNLLVMGGMHHAESLSKALSGGMPSGSSIVYSTHDYTTATGATTNQAGFHNDFGYLTATAPVIAGEFGEYDCEDTYTSSEIPYYNAPDGDATRRMGYTAWAYNDPGSCTYPSVIANWTGTASTEGAPIKTAELGYATSVPTEPANLVATGGVGKVVLSWNGVAPVNNTAPTNSYNVLRSTTTGGPYTSIQSGVTGDSYTDTSGLTDGLNYYYVVQATNSNGTGPNSAEASGVPASSGAYFSVTAAPVSTSCAAPSNSTTYNVSVKFYNGFAGTVNLTAGGLPSGASAVFGKTSFTATGTTTLVVTAGASTPTGTDILTITGASLSTSVTPSVPFTVMDLPSTPTGVSINYVGTEELALTWTASTGASTYNVERATSSSGPFTLISSTPWTTYADYGVIGSTKYYYYIQAANCAGVSSASSKVNDTPGGGSITVSPSPSSQTVSPGGGTSYTVTIGAVNSFATTAYFEVQGLPTGATASFSPVSVSTSGSTTLTVTTSSSTPAGTYDLTINGVAYDGNLVVSAPVTLVVN